MNDHGPTKTRSVAILGSRGIPAEFGGFETFAEQLAVRLVARGYKVTVFCEYSQSYRKPDYKGVRLVYLRTPAVPGLRSIWFDSVCILRSLRGYDAVCMLGYHAAFAFVLPWLLQDGHELEPRRAASGDGRAQRQTLANRSVQPRSRECAAGALARSAREAPQCRSAPTHPPSRAIRC